jgi:hypothetical protein
LSSSGQTFHRLVHPPVVTPGLTLGARAALREHATSERPDKADRLGLPLPVVESVTTVPRCPGPFRSQPPRFGTSSS